MASDLRETVSKELECPICLDLFTKPVSLPCAHSVCDTHVAGLVRNGQLTCPLCKACSKYDETTRLPINYIAQSLVESLRREQAPVICAECSSDAAANAKFCASCDVVLCAPCLEKTHGSKVMQRHAVTDFSPSKIKEVHASKPQMCGLHDEPLKYLCMDDRELACRDCFAMPKAPHKDHAYVTVKDASKSAREKFVTDLARAQGFSQRFEDAIGEIRSAIHVLEQAGQEASRMLHHRSDAFIKDYRASIAAIEDEKDQLVAQHRDTLAAQAKVLEAQLKSLAQSQSFGQKLSQCSDDLEILSAQLQLEGQLKVLSERTLYLDVLQEISVRFDFADIAVPKTARVVGPVYDMNIFARPRSYFFGGGEQDLVVDKIVQLEAGKVHEFGNVTVRRGGTLTVAPWNGQTGGTLVIKVSKTLSVEKGGTIDVTGKGYRGGESCAAGTEGICFQGESWQGVPSQSCDSCFGGGGGGMQSGGFGSIGGGGGSYRSLGYDAAPNKYGNGANRPGGKAGKIYGEPDLSRVYMGSGGGGGARYTGGGSGGAGGSGGGAIVILARFATIHGNVFGNGSPGQNNTHNGSGGGGGSGGSIVMIVESARFSKTAAFSACGGPGGSTAIPLVHPGIASAGGVGGNGAIRINAEKLENAARFEPQPILDAKTATEVPGILRVQL